MLSWFILRIIFAIFKEYVVFLAQEGKKEKEISINFLNEKQPLTMGFFLKYPAFWNCDNFSIICFA